MSIRRILLAVVLCGCAGPESFEEPPSIEVGTGQYAFEPVRAGMRVPIVRGLQGGTHVWLGVRVKNMSPRDLYLESTMFDEDGEPIGGPLYFEVNLFEGPAGEMETAGLPHQAEAEAMFFENVRIEVVATDRDGRTATGFMVVQPR